MADDGWLMTDRKERMRRFPSGFLASVIGHWSSAIVFLRETSRTDSQRKTAGQAFEPVRRISEHGTLETKATFCEDPPGRFSVGFYLVLRSRASLVESRKSICSQWRVTPALIGLGLDEAYVLGEMEGADIMPEGEPAAVITYSG